MEWEDKIMQETMIVAQTKATVKDWHPKCETCGHGTHRIDGDLDCALARGGRWDDSTDPQWYCSDHTALRGEEE